MAIVIPALYALSDVDDVTEMLGNRDACHAQVSAGTSLLYHACKKGYLDIVKHILTKDGTDPNEFTGSGEYPLCIACQNGYICVVDALLGDQRINVDNQHLRYDMTPLHFACRHKHINIVKKLLEKRANTTVEDNVGRTPIFYACENGFADIIKEIITDAAGCPCRYRPYFPTCCITTTTSEETLQLQQQPLRTLGF